MTTPTQAQIEAAAKVIEENVDSLDPDDHKEIAKAALTPAAGVGELNHKIKWLAERLGEEALKAGERAVECSELKKKLTATIERCAQVAENFNAAGKPIAAAIRALKEKP